MATDVTVRDVVSTEAVGSVLEFLTKEEFAEKVRTGVDTISYWRKIGYGPKGVRVGRRVLYRMADVNAFLDELFGGGEAA